MINALNLEYFYFIGISVLAYIGIALVVHANYRLFMILPAGWANDLKIIRSPLTFLLMVGIFLLWRKQPFFPDVLQSELLQDIGNVLLTLAIVWFAVRGFSFLLFNMYLGRKQKQIIPNVIRWLIRQLLYLAIIIFYVHLVYDFALGDLIVTGAILIIVFSIAFQRPLSNIFSDLYASFSNSFSYGDFVEIGTSRGMVLESEWQHLKLLDSDGNHVFVPVKQLLENPAKKIHGLDTGHTVFLMLPVSGVLPPNQVEQLLLDTALSADNVLHTPAPKIYQEEGDGELIRYTIACATENYWDTRRIKHQLRSLAWYKLHRAGLMYPFGPSAASPLSANCENPNQQRRDIIRLLNETPFFSPLSDNEIEHLAKLSRLELYGRGERLFKQGDPGDSLYIIYSGQVSIRVCKSPAQPQEVEVNTLGSGAFFGEISLLTGTPRSAGVVFREESKIICIDKTAFHTILSNNPAIVEALTDIMMERKAHLIQLDENDGTDKQERYNLLNSIRAFFQL